MGENAGLARRFPLAGKYWENDRVMECVRRNGPKGRELFVEREKNPIVSFLRWKSIQLVNLNKPESAEFSILIGQKVLICFLLSQPIKPCAFWFLFLGLTPPLSCHSCISNLGNDGTDEKTGGGAKKRRRS